MSFQLVTVVKKHMFYVREVEDGVDIYLKSNRIKHLLTLSECFYDFRVLF